MTRILIVSAAFAAGLGSACPLPGQTLDRADAIATAQAILVSYQTRDLARLATLANANNRPLLQELAAQGERHPRYAELFRGWRWEAVERWDGAVGDVRYQDRDEALALFGQIAPDEVAVVVLTWEAGGWAFEDINSPGRASFEALPRDRPSPP